MVAVGERRSHPGGFIEADYQEVDESSGTSGNGFDSFAGNGFDRPSGNGFNSFAGNGNGSSSGNEFGSYVGGPSASEEFDQW